MNKERQMSITSEIDKQKRQSDIGRWWKRNIREKERASEEEKEQKQRQRDALLIDADPQLAY